MTIIMDENNDIQFLHIVKIMQRMNVDVPENVLENVKVCTKTITFCLLICKLIYNKILL